ncbi:Nitrogen assimilation transcription factor nit-4 [Claviceps maximensis]|nr:Nitrogen assimilation transcription factor nit-4 [Claviceps maximensis]
MSTASSKHRTQQQMELQGHANKSEHGVTPGMRADTRAAPANKKSRRRADDAARQKRRCVSTACIACRKRKSKCDGALPSCAACASVYSTECIYDPNSDHRRKGVYREKADSMKARNATLQILVEAILNASEDHVSSIVHRIRSCDDLDSVAQAIVGHSFADDDNDNDNDDGDGAAPPEERSEDYSDFMAVEGEKELARKMGELRFENGSVRFIGGTSHLVYLGDSEPDSVNVDPQSCQQQSTSGDPVSSWTTVTDDCGLITHLINMYFNYHFTYFTVLSKKLFFRDFLQGRDSISFRNSTTYCSSLLVNSMLALGCHFTDIAGAFDTPGDARTKGDHFFAEARRLILENDEFAKPRLATVQGLALMSVREAGCGREAKGWVYSGMSFRMAQDMGLNLEVTGMDKEYMSEEDIDARKITYWGCFVFDKCWSNYLGRLPQLPKTSCNISRFGICPEEDMAMWSPLTDTGFDASLERPSYIRSAALQLASLCEISSDLLVFFYHPNHIGRSRGKSAELKNLSEIHRRLEHWRKSLPQHFEPTDDQMPNVILMHMFFHLQYIHLFRPFLKYTSAASPLPAHVSPRRICTANAGAVSKLMRLYRKLYGMRQICNIAVYMVHSACTIHLLNLPEKSARRDITHGVKHLEEIADDWLCARRTLSILSVLSRKWGCDLPEDAAQVLRRADEKYGHYSTSDVPSPTSSHTTLGVVSDDGALSPGHCNAQDSTSHVPVNKVIGQQPLYEAMDPMQQSSQTTRQLYHYEKASAEVEMQMNLDADVLETRWTYNSASAASSGNYLPFSPLDQHAFIQQPGRSVVRRRVPNEPGQDILNAQDWMLHDGARWQHNFERWDICDANGPPPEAFPFSHKRNTSFHKASEAGQDDRGHAVFGDFAASLSGGEWLSSLE